jgi:hypothetical protein
MQVLTREQRKALKMVFDRQALTAIEHNGRIVAARWENYSPSLRRKMTYREFRKLARVSFGALMVPWCGMWLGIEQDGYTHS